jgi:hypothetical protein
VRRVIFRALLGHAQHRIGCRYRAHSVRGLGRWIFVGMIAAALTETLDIISVAANKLKIVRWIYLIVVVILLGKIIGSLLYFIVPGFF